MKQKLLKVLLVGTMVGVLFLTGCGEKYVCRRCNNPTGKIYYDIDGDAAYCADCAKDYWAPLDYKDYCVD